MPPVWTYDPTNLTSELAQVRVLIGDVLSDDQLMWDQEITFFIGLNGTNIYGAAADCCQMIAGKFARKVDIVQGELKTNYSNQAKAYYARAVQMRLFSSLRGPGVPYAGGTSIADKTAQQENNDRVVPSFNIGMQDNALPLSAAGNETPTSNPPVDNSGP